MIKRYIFIVSLVFLAIIMTSCGEKPATKTSLATTTAQTEAQKKSGKADNTDTSKQKEKPVATTTQTSTASAQSSALSEEPETEDKTKPEDNEKIDYSYKSGYAKIRCPEVPYYGFTDPLETLLYKKYDRAVKRNEATKYKGDIAYRNYKNGVEIVTASDSGKIPETIEGRPVIKIGGYLECSEPVEGYSDVDTFYESFFDSGVKRITIPSGVKEIVFNNFEPLTELEKINVSPDNPYYSSADGILYNKDKTVLLFIPLNHQGGEIKIPDTVKTAYSLFSNNTVTVNVPASVKKLSSTLNVRGEYTNSVYNLEELSIDSLLESVNVDKANTAYSSINGVLYNKNKTKLFVYPRNRDEKVLKIPDSVKTIDYIYLDFYDNLKEIDFGKKIRKIGFCSEPAMAGYDKKLTIKGYKSTPVRKWAKALGDNVKFIALD